VATAQRIGDLLPVLASLDPAELLVAEGDIERWKGAPHDQARRHALHAFAVGRTVTELPAYRFETAPGARVVAEAIGVLNLEGFGLGNDHPALGPAGALVGYATDNLCAKPENLRNLQEYRSASTLLLDPATLRNLEIFASVRGGRDGSLLAAIDGTTTAAGRPAA
jgi:DNA mismatch repair protein MutS